MQVKFLRLTLFVFVFPFIQTAMAQTDSLKLTLPEAEKIFLQNNLSLLAAKYNIDASQALIQQAKLWDNPVLITDQNVWDASGGWFKHNKDYGQVFVQVSQLIKTAGKRTKLAQLASDNTEIARAQFDDVMHSLRYTLRTDLFEVHYLLKTKKIYDDEISEVQKLIEGFEEQYKAGNISMRENMRLKALLFSLKNDEVNIQSQIIPVQSEVKLLLQSTDSSFIVPVLEYTFANLTTAEIPGIDSLVKTALVNRPDAKIAKTALDFETHNLTYQKALAKPDLTVGPEFDQRSNYAPNYVGLSVALPLNIFNRNQGNIKSAQFNIKQQEAQTNQAYSRIENDVQGSYKRFKYFQEVNNRQQLEFATQYDTLFSNMLKSYQQRQISLLEFIDFVDAYKDTKLKLAEQHNNFLKSIEDLNFSTGSVILKL